MERSEKQKRGREVFLSEVFSRAWPWHSVQAPTSWVRDSVIDPPIPHPPLTGTCSLAALVLAALAPELPQPGSCL